jgi:hypothetical protein
VVNVGLALGEMWVGPKFRYHPGWATLRLPEPSQREADALGSDMTHPLSPSPAEWLVIDLPAVFRPSPKNDLTANRSVARRRECCASRHSARLPESDATCRTQRKTPGAHSPDDRSHYPDSQCEPSVSLSRDSPLLQPHTSSARYRTGAKSGRAHSYASPGSDAVTSY